MTLNPNSKIEELVESSLNCHLASTWQKERADLIFKGWHALPNYVVSLLISGELETSIRTSSGAIETVSWRAGDVICLPPALARKNRIVSKGRISYCGIAITFEMLHRLDPLSFFEVPFLIRKSKASKIGGLLLEIIKINETDSPFIRSSARKSLCFSILQNLLAAAQLKDDAEYRLSGLDRIIPALDYLVTKCKAKPDLAYMAQQTSLSQSRLHAVFKEVVGCSPGDFVKRRRLKKAADMLINTDLRVSEICQTYGWNDPFHFSRTFKDSFGVSPRTYRERFRSGIHSL